MKSQLLPSFESWNAAVVSVNSKLLQYFESWQDIVVSVKSQLMQSFESWQADVPESISIPRKHPESIR